MDESAQRQSSRLPLLLGATAILLGLIFIAWVWLDRREFHSTGLVPIVLGLMSMAAARRRRDSA